MSSLVQRRDRKVKEGFSKKLPVWAIILIVLASIYVLIYVAYPAYILTFKGY